MKFELGKTYKHNSGKKMKIGGNSMSLIKRLKKLLTALSTKYEYAMCYTANEGKGAIFGMCSNCNDRNCPHFVAIQR